MTSGVRLFLRILRAELEDLMEDFAVVEERYRVRFEKSEITKHVLMENEALLSREKDSIGGFLAALDDVDESAYSATDELVVDLIAKAKELVRNHDDPESLVFFIKRKIDKILGYLNEGGCA